MRFQDVLRGYLRRSAGVNLGIVISGVQKKTGDQFVLPMIITSPDTPPSNQERMARCKRLSDADLIFMLSSLATDPDQTFARYELDRRRQARTTRLPIIIALVSAAASALSAYCAYLTIVHR